MFSNFGCLAAVRQLSIFAAVVMINVVFGAYAQAVSFIGEKNYPAGQTPMFSAGGDFNNDGKADMVVTNWSGNTVTVLFGNGHGVLQTGPSSTAGTAPDFVTTGDFNSDEKTDLVVVSTSTNKVTILLGIGDGRFTLGSTSAAGTSPTQAAVGDLNGDGKLDIVVANIGSNNVSILLGNGNGTFAPAINYVVGAMPVSVAVGDFNRDGKIDLAVANYYDYTVSILLGNGNGTFMAATNYSTGPLGYSPRSVVNGDFNGDGKADIATANHGSGTVSVLMGNGDGTFQSAINYSAGTTPIVLITDDLDGDGAADFAVVSGYDKISILLGNGDGTFQADQACVATSIPGSLIAEDFNADGKRDLAGTDSGGSTGNAFVLLGRGDGSFETASHVGVGNNPRSVITNDFNNDGYVDLATVNGNGYSFSILLGNGDGTFQSTIDTYVAAASDSVISEDFNQDGNADIAIALYAYKSVAIFLGNGDGTFQAATNFIAGSNPRGVAAGDFNGDSKFDLAVANYGGDTISVLMGNGDGTFQAAVNYGAGNHPYSVGVNDLNGDGKQDIIVTNFTSSDVSIFIGNGNGTFQAAVNYVAAVNPCSMTVGDFNVDGRRDLAVANGYSIAILIGNGDGTFAAAVHYWAGNFPRSVTIGDFNDDGRIDLAVANYTGHNASILSGNGDGTFQAPVYHGTRNSPISLAAGDFDGNGKVDLAVASAINHVVSVLLNNMPRISSTPVSHGIITCFPSMVDPGGRAYCTITPDPGYVLEAVSGCGGNLSSSTYTITAATADCTVSASFALITWQLKVSVIGSGSVTSTPAGIDCGFICAPSFATGTYVTLHATPASGFIFAGWSGDTDCIDGMVTMKSPTSCTAVFNAVPTPTVVITSPVSGITNDNRPRLAYTATAGTVVVTVDSVVVAMTSGDKLDLLADGIHTIRVDVTDNIGQKTSASVMFTVDTTAPVVSLISPTAGLTNNRTPLLSYTVSDGTMVVKVDGIVVNKTSGTQLDPLPDGPHTVRVETTDTAGNYGMNEVTFTVDTAPPTVSIDPVQSPIKKKHKHLTITGTREKGAAISVSLGPVAVVGAVSYETDTTWLCTVSGLQRKTRYSVTATARDAAGNIASANTDFSSK